MAARSVRQTVRHKASRRDIYFVNEGGYFWFQAGADDMIVSAGYNIAGPEVEGAARIRP